MCSRLAVCILFVLSALLMPASVGMASSDIGGGVGVNGDIHAKGKAAKRAPSSKKAPSSKAAPRKEKRVISLACADIAVDENTNYVPGSCQIIFCDDGRPTYATITVHGDEVAVNKSCVDAQYAQISAQLEQIFQHQVTVTAPRRQPDTDTTLVQWPVVYYSDFVSHDLATTLLGQAVTIRIIPARYTWRFGDGTTKTTTSPGKPVDLDRYATPHDIEQHAPISHRYHKCGTVDATVTVTFGGEFSINGGPFYALPGQATVTSPPAPLTLREARAQLIDPHAGSSTPSPRPCHHHYDD